ncbi:GIY-YIG nuclease family protein [Miniphocaeibacter halophilus]|uniref:GIY-YIG nuclease family protein n=1 Tax=Miniphocaeibacter halophilus TaxID=2931922 RepID=A0AC61MTT0_9FIRM|nr:GIY-YIG nuclease family protein [Miniphocaeibacter halophilus]QQK08788.1 GIY-YIG nuclease family protein [Miniphocaeibacter halophilus]
MDKEKKKKLLEEYKNRKPDKGIISIKNKTEGKEFLTIAKDKKADINSMKMKLKSNWHPNKELQELWNKYGEGDFQIDLIEQLKYDDLQEDYSNELEELLEIILLEKENAKRLEKKK